jgi:Electron transfer DM13
VDPTAAAALAAWFARGDAGLRAFATGEQPVLWPEHFDLGIAVDEVNYGISPGDAGHAIPCAYIGRGPHAKARSGTRLSGRCAPRPTCPTPTRWPPTSPQAARSRQATDPGSRAMCNKGDPTGHCTGMTDRKPYRRLLRRRLTWIVVAAGMVVVVVGALVFEPWKLFIDERVDEAPPAVVAGAAGGTSTGQVVLARGQLISHEHQSSGSVVVYRLADGSRVLRLEDLNTSNGPALHVWLSDAPVIEGNAGWGVFDDGRYVDLGALKGNIGSSNYLIPPDVDLTALSSASIWCARFHVSFAATRLSPPQ